MFHNPLDNRSLYNIYDFTMRALQPYSDYYANLAKRNRRVSDMLNLPVNVPYLSEQERQLYSNMLNQSASHFRKMAGYCYVFHMLTNIHGKPKFNINEIKMGDEYYEIREDIIDRKSFCNLIHFEKRKMMN